jgi:general secretion pathway protein K
VRKCASDEGYALLAAIAAIAVFSTLALGVLGQVQASILQANAEVERAHANAAAEAGVQLAIQNLISDDRAFRWSLDGRPRQWSFAGSQVTIRVMAENGKVPLAALDEKQARKLFEMLGVPEDRLDVATDSYLDWTDDDDEPRPNGAEYAYYSRRHIHPPNSLPQSIDELVLVRGFDVGLVNKLKQVATLHFGSGSFDPRHASPTAIAALAAGGEDSPEEIEAEREAAGERTAIELDDKDTAGRTAEIDVEVVTAGGGKSRRRQVVELTGNKDRPYAILEAE